MWSVVSSGELPHGERFEWFADMISREVMPTMLTSERPAEFSAEAALLDLGELQVSKVAYSPLRSRRTPALIRRGDPEQYQLGLVTKGAMTLVQNGNSCEAETGDLVFWDTSRPSDARYVSDGDPGQLVILQLPRDVLPVRASHLDGVLARRMPGGRGWRRSSSPSCARSSRTAASARRTSCAGWGPPRSISRRPASRSTRTRRSGSPPRCGRGRCSAGSMSSSSTTSATRK